MKKQERDKLRRKQELLEIRQKNMAKTFLNFAGHFLPWVHELTRRYKERGEYPVMACWLLPSYYDDPNDVKIAAFAAQLIRDDENVMERVDAFRCMMGESPFEWFRCRVFVSLSIGRTGDERTGGVNNRRIAEYMNSIYESWRNLEEEYPSIFVNFFDKIHCQTKERLLRLILGASDGLGRGVWTTTPSKVQTPLTGDVFAFLRTFWPDYRKYRDIDGAIRLFGFEKEYDMFYAALAYRELQRTNPKGCHKLATLFQKRYDEANFLTWKNWAGSRGILPEINF